MFLSVGHLFEASYLIMYIAFFILTGDSARPALQLATTLQLPCRTREATKGWCSSVQGFLRKLCTLMKWFVTYGTPVNISNKTCRIFASSEVDSLWQNGLMRLENRAAEVDLRGRPLSCHVSHVWNDTLKRCETVLRIHKDRKSGILPWTYSFRMMVKLG